MTTITVRSRGGQITLPIDLREEMGIDEDEILAVTLLKKTAEMARKRGITLEEMMAEWDDVRRNS